MQPTIEADDVLHWDDAPSAVDATPRRTTTRAGLAARRPGGSKPARRRSLASLARSGPHADVTILPAVPLERVPQLQPGHTLLDALPPGTRLGWVARVGSAGTKRAMDVVLSLVALLVVLPVLLVILAAVRLSSPGPALFRQERLGRAGRTFTCLKFRTMHADAGARLERVLEADQELRQEWEATQKLKRDPRVTRVGALLRRTSLDELPQLLNIVRGDMSLVGPRPIVEPERQRYGAAMSAVLSVRPGLTGLWQVSGRNDTTYRERVSLDLRYVETRSLGLDLLICLRTARQMILVRRNGAY